MSIEATFSRVSFPSLRGTTASDDDRRSRASGHSAGYAAGLRAAADEMAAQAAQHEAALAQALADGQARIHEALSVLNAASQALARRTVPVVAEAQDAIAATAVELAEAIIGRELSHEETSASSALHRALADVEPDLVRQVRLNPEDLAVLERQGALAAGITFVADATLGRGDAISEFEDGYLDARIATALARARSALLEEGP
jgi:flagellar assembly protein FliH